jgi:hypothetical protein
MKVGGEMTRTRYSFVKLSDFIVLLAFWTLTESFSVSDTYLTRYRSDNVSLGSACEVACGCRNAGCRPGRLLEGVPLVLVGSTPARRLNV